MRGRASSTIAGCASARRMPAVSSRSISVRRNVALLVHARPLRPRVTRWHSEHKQTYSHNPKHGRPRVPPNAPADRRAAQAKTLNESTLSRSSTNPHRLSKMPARHVWASRYLAIVVRPKHKKYVVLIQWLTWLKGLL